MTPLTEKEAKSIAISIFHRKLIPVPPNMEPWMFDYFVLSIFKACEDEYDEMVRAILAMDDDGIARAARKTYPKIQDVIWSWIPKKKRKKTVVVAQGIW